MTALLTSEFQLAGYECYTARTAVEVFDVIARNSIQLVLINLAQAATTRHEFWVALETQRRGRGIQVLSFRCSNLAGYGPIDPEERPQEVMADMEVDGMQGLIRLIETVRVRVPTADASASSPQQLPKSTIPLPIVPPSPLTQQNAAPWASSTPTGPLPSRNGMSFQAEFPPDDPPRSGTQKPYYATLPQNQNAVSQSMPPASPASMRAQAPASMPQTSMSGKGAAGTGKPSYVEKIRAVLYPNQRTWSSQGKSSSSTMPDNNNKIDIQISTQQNMPTNPGSVETPILQRLANGQTESSLAQLSRMVQERKTPAREYTNSSAAYHPPEKTQFGQQGGIQASHMANGHPPYQPDRTSYVPATARPAQYPENFNAIPLRASPIQDLPGERNANGQGNTDSLRRPDVLSRTNYGQQSTPMPSLSSIATTKPTSPTSPFHATPPPALKSASLTPIPPHAEAKEKTTDMLSHQKIEERKKVGKRVLVEQQTEDTQDRPRQDDVTETEGVGNNALLMDIMQSLPPMPPPSVQPPQALQPQVLNGRATRSLGSVLIAGHLVPQSRLEVAENIQRMLCGVDLNYQLGEILLMFKLLTPDQLLAASLVSFGLITTTQISALGRIRQELHAMGLEYDLENLLILFRILTPEQLREAKSSWQG